MENNDVIAQFVMKSYQMVNDPAVRWTDKGFRKVDPDRWEFANEWFLKGHTHLLKNIVRRKHCRNGNLMTQMKQDDNGDEILMEISKLKKKQRVLKAELECINKRLEATEWRPRQMMAFLSNEVENPNILPRMMLERRQMKRLSSSEKKGRLLMS